MTAPVRSRVRSGSLKFGGTGPLYADSIDFSCNYRSVKVKPSSTKDGDDTEVLCGDFITAERTRSFTLEGSSIQQFDDPAGFQAYCYQHDGETLHFTLKLNACASPTFSGDVVVTALEEGGDVGADAGDVDFSFDGVGWYVRTPSA